MGRGTLNNVIEGALGRGAALGKESSFQEGAKNEEDGLREVPGTQ